MTTPADHPLFEGEEKNEDLGSSGDTAVTLVGHGGVEIKPVNIDDI